VDFHLAEKAKVYFANAKYRRGIGGPTQKFLRLLELSELKSTIKHGDRTAIKMHFGEPGNCRYMRPIFAALTVDYIKSLGGKPFLTDAPVMYKSERDNYFGYLEAARRNGFTTETMGCPLVISGGIKDDGVEVQVKNPLILEKVTVSRDVWEADFLFSLAHFTMHMEFPYAGCLKNISMGCMDRKTKMEMHSVRKFHLPHLNVQAANSDGAKVMLEHFKGKIFAVNIALDVTPECDCFGKTDLPITPDAGIFVSTDMAACDKAAYDTVTALPGYPGCLMEGKEGMAAGGNKAVSCHSKLGDGHEYEEYIIKAGISSLEYELVADL